MTRINTNVSSLTAQNRLQRTNNDLQTALTRLSTGLRINSGKDDPAGLIASESLRSDITSINKALSNTQRATQIIGTADSALSQVSSLLNDIRGLVVEAANNGAISDDEIAANQLQIDSSLEAINRISQTTTFQGRRLLDGSLDFVTQAGAGFSTVSNLQIDQANLGASGAVDVAIDITAAATKASISNSGVAPTANAAQATTSLVLTETAAATEATGTITLTDTGETFDLTAVDGGLADGTTGNSTDVVFQSGATTGAVYDNGTNILTVTVAAGATLAQVATAINTEGTFATSNVSNGATVFDQTTGGTGDLGTITNPLSTGTDTTYNNTITVTADDSTPSTNGLTVTLIEDASITAGTASASFNGSNLEVRIRNSGNTSVGAIATALDSLAGYSASVNVPSGASGIYNATTTAPPAAGTFAGGVSGGGLAADVVFQLSGSLGSEVFNFKAGAGITDIVNSINLVKDATGVEASDVSGALRLESTIYGSKSLVAIEVISEGAGGSFASGLTASRASGTDISAKVNGFDAIGNGNTISLNTSTLDLTLTVNDGSSTDVNFTITGGGALFQLGPDVVSNQQARLGISSVNTAKLGSSNGRLYELASGGTKTIALDANSAASVVDDVINKISTLRGRLGAFQRTALESNYNSLSDTLANLTEAQSSIRDADFAKESSNLTRAQILVQSGTSVLGIANQSSQNVLALLR